MSLDWRDALPAVKGQLIKDADLSSRSWFGVGGPAELLFLPADTQDLADLLKALPPEVPVFVLGRGSNLLIRDNGIKGLVVKLEGQSFEAIIVKDQDINAGAGAADLSVAIAARKASLDGMTFLVGVPGTIGGALRMNAGIGAGKEMRDVLVSATAVDRSGEIRTFSLDELNYSYRSCGLGPEWIFTNAHLRGRPGNRGEIASAMKDHQAYRRENQPVNKKTGGSTFKNPPGHSAWRVVDEAGMRGYSVGAAQMSELHCNFMINNGGATAEEIEQLGEDVRAAALKHSGIELEWEIKRIGEKK